ncbi:sensor histidine kinase [Cohnella candidum]|uniref:histidine kinase n=1 Tax=Cohnella candidum TaxID=2674991 RepID=A0A3G3JXV3_9BACL|nr:sensor histidine kinase [Cohnella candidum]AYQ72349.1 sensor histidine kinase [Cohnella candidum]
MRRLVSAFRTSIRQNKLFYSLKNRVTAVFLLSSMITFILVSAASYYTIYSILYNKIEKSIQLTLDQVSRDTDSAMDNLLSVSSQLSYGGIVSNDLANFLSTDSYSSKRTHYDNINSYLNLIDYTNPTAGFHFYYRKDSKDILFGNANLNRDFSLDGLPVLTQKTLFTFYGPYKSFSGGQSDLVISMSRPVDIQGDYSLKLYLESNLSVLPRILKTEQLGMPVSYAIVSDAGQVVYSELPDVLTQGAAYAGGLKSTPDAYLFESGSHYGWKLLAAFNKSAFNLEIRNWALRMGLLGIGVMLISLMLGYVVWRAVYVPIRVFKKEINLMASSQFDTVTERTNVAEFDKVLKEFHQMKDRIQSLLVEVKQKETDKRQLEVDKLLSQINPHFLYNTLNTVQWIARAERQPKIVKLVAELTRLLRYNLGKEGSVVTVARELSALKDYVSLQLVRNDHQFEVLFEVDEGVDNVAIPRFILQPLVENAIYHGLNEGEGTIVVKVAKEGPNLVTVQVQDDGAGLSEDRLRLMLEGGREGRTDVGLGIGLSYVNKMLEVHYGEGCKLSIDSLPGAGTTYSFAIPNREVQHHEDLEQQRA